LGSSICWPVTQFDKKYIAAEKSFANKTKFLSKVFAFLWRRTKYFFSQEEEEMFCSKSV